MMESQVRLIVDKMTVKDPSCIESLVSKSIELYRKLNITMPVGFLKDSEHYRLYALVEIACNELSVSYERKNFNTFLKSVIKPHERSLVLNKIMNVLKVQDNGQHLLEKLVRKYDYDSRMINQVKYVLEEFKKNEIKQKRSGQISNLITLAACFVVNEESEV